MSQANNLRPVQVTSVQEETVRRDRKKINIYGCGGCGGNLLATMMRNYDTGDGLADIRAFWIDTSASDVASHGELVNKDNLFLLPQSDGAGKDRSKLGREIQRIMPSIIERFQIGRAHV